jgi:hypothetical protein
MVGKSEIMSKLTTLSVASAFNCPGMEDKSIYLDVRNGENWVHQWIEKLFVYAKIIARHNKYTDDDFDNMVPSATIDRINEMVRWNEVPVLGFNSARFDMNLILNELNCDEWNVSVNGCMITERNIRNLKVILALH